MLVRVGESGKNKRVVYKSIVGGDIREVNKFRASPHILIFSHDIDMYAFEDQYFREHIRFRSTVRIIVKTNQSN